MVGFPPKGSNPRCKFPKCAKTICSSCRPPHLSRYSPPLAPPREKEREREREGERERGRERERKRERERERERKKGGEREGGREEEREIFTATDIWPLTPCPKT